MNRLKKLLGRYEISSQLKLLVILFFVAFFLRAYLLSDNLFFGPEQGRDFLVIKDIVQAHKPTLIGSETDIEGVFHGPLFYYIASAPFFLSRGDPYFVILFFIFFHSLTVFTIYFLGKELFSPKIGLFSAVLYTVSFSAIVTSRWLSNPPLSLPLSCLFFLFFLRFLKGSQKSILMVAFIFGLLVQVQFLNLLFFSFIVFAIVLMYKDKIFRIKKVYFFVAVLIATLLSFGTYALFDLRHNFLISYGILRLVSGESGYYVSYFHGVGNLINVFTTSFANLLFPANKHIAVVFLVGAFFFFLRRLWEEKAKSHSSILLVWLGIPIVMLFLLRHSILDHYFIPLFPAMIIITAVALDEMAKYTKVLSIGLVSILISVNIFYSYASLKKNTNIYFQSNQLDLRFIDQKMVIDEIYKRSSSKDFSFQAYTIPYWSQQGWEYMFWYYGFQRYGYLPLPEKSHTLFVIIQDDPSSRAFQQRWLKETVSKWGKLENSFRYGILTVEELKT